MEIINRKKLDYNYLVLNLHRQNADLIAKIHFCHSRNFITVKK